MSDNYRVNVINDKKEVFDAAIDLIFLDQPKHCQGAYSYIIKDGCLIFASGYDNKNGKFVPDKGSVEFPFQVSISFIKQFAWEWVQNTPIAELEPDSDGFNKQGFWINDSHSVDPDELSIWHGSAGNVSLGIFLVKPVWSMYGK